MTLLTIARAVADEVGVDRPSSVVGNSDPDVQRLLRLCNKAGITLMKRIVWQDLRKEQTFTSVATETQTAILPDDFDRIVPETFWDRDTIELWTGPITPSQWQSLKANSYTGKPKFILRGGAILAIPVPAAGLSLAFEYVSNLWCTDSGATGQAAWAADTDLGVIDEELITRATKYYYLADQGLPAAIALNEFNEYLHVLQMNDQPMERIMVAGDIFGQGRHFTGEPKTSGYNLNVLT